jgi:hypothetical protein
MKTLYTVSTTEAHIFTDYNSAKEYATQYMILCSIAKEYVGDAGCGEVRYVREIDGSICWNDDYIGSEYYLEDIAILSESIVFDECYPLRLPTFWEWKEHCQAISIVLPKIETHRINIEDSPCLSYRSWVTK